MLSKKEMAWLQSLHQKKHRQEQQLFIAEGRKVVEELLRSRLTVRTVYTAAQDNELPDWLKKHQHLCIPVSAKDMERISALTTSPEILAVAEIPHPAFDQAKVTGHPVPVLDDISDPGNLGTIVRLADWFGFPAVVCSLKTVDAFNPKAIQAAMGSMFRVEIYYMNLEEIFTANKASSHPVPVYAATLGGENLYEAPLDGPGYILFGNESQGLGSRFKPFITHALTIPPSGGQAGAESLNVAVAAAIVCSEFHRRKK